jgi:hypothetical protein
MISFPETLSAVERLSDLLKSATDLELAVKDTYVAMDSYISMCEFSHTKQFKDAKSVISYIDNVLIPQLLGIRDSLEAGTEEHLKRLKVAGDQAERLMLRLQMLVNGSAGDLLL